jgi:cell division protein FtsZ
MNIEASQPPNSETPRPGLSIKVFGIGGAGIKVIEQLIPDRLGGLSFVALDTDPVSINRSSAEQKAHLETKMLRGLSTGGDPERGAAAAEEHAPRLRALCEGADVVFIVAGLGGGAGTGIGPVLARAAKAAGALVLGFVTFPFDCEGGRRGRLAMDGLAELKAAADGVVCFAQKKIFKNIE